MEEIKLIEITDNEWTKIEGFSSKGRREKSWYENNKTSEIFLYKEPKVFNSTGFVTKEIWTEFLAYKIGTLFALNVPIAIPAKNKDNFGILIKSFLKKNNEMPEIELAEAQDILSRTGIKLYHNLNTINFIFNNNKYVEKDSWLRYKEMLVFDCIIGNNDRHDQNWGLLYGNALEKIKIAPIYDNASCLTYGDNEEKIIELLANETKFEKYVNKSKPPNLYINENNSKHYNHFEIIQYLIKEEHDTIEIIKGMVQKDCLGYTENVLDRIIQMDVPEDHKLTENRKILILKILDYRIKKLKDIINVHN